MSRLTGMTRAFQTYAQRHEAARRRILVTDDDLFMRNFVERVLAAAGYVTVTAADGPEALTTCETTESFDLLVTDFMMPAMDGAELARQVRRARPSMKVLYLTGYSDALFDAKGQLWSDEAFLEKPCSPDGLVEAVSLLINDRTVQKTVWS